MTTILIKTKAIAEELVVSKQDTYYEYYTKLARDNSGFVFFFNT